MLIAAWAMAVLRDKGPYPVIVLSGEQGSAKSTFSAILRALLDPNSAPLRALPREDRDHPIKESAISISNRSARCGVAIGPTRRVEPHRPLV